MTPEKKDKTLELSKHWSVDSTPARNEVIMKADFIHTKRTSFPTKIKIGIYLEELK